MNGKGTIDFFIEDLDKLTLSIKTLGYPCYGESIMISLKDGEHELYNVITDCYEVRSNHNWTDFLSKDTRINAFIWTHPDEDHSMGVATLMETFDPECNARIFIPASLTKELLERNKKDAAIDTYLYLKEKYNVGKKYELWNEVSLTKYEAPRFLISIKIKETSTNITLTFKIGFMAPIGAISNRRIDVENMSSGQMNDLSLFYVVQINSTNYVFAGDLSKQMIQFIDEDYLSNCRFVKIPHHGSKDSIKLIDKIQPSRSLKLHSVTTTFKDSHPFDIVLDKYANKSDAVFSTGRGKEPYGMVEINYNIKNINIFNIELKGNALQVRP